MYRITYGYNDRYAGKINGRIAYLVKLSVVGKIQ